MLLLAAEELGTVATDHELAVEGGTVRIRVRRPAGAQELPAVYFLHGGGWFQGARHLDPAGHPDVRGGTGRAGGGLRRAFADQSSSTRSR
jgi:hypothetical protein